MCDVDKEQILENSRASENLYVLGKLEGTGKHMDALLPRDYKMRREHI